MTHYSFHTGEQPFAFLECYTNFKDEKSMQRHDPVHCSDKTFICATCGKRFTLVNNHMRFLNMIQILTMRNQCSHTIVSTLQIGRLSVLHVEKVS